MANTDLEAEAHALVRENETPRRRARPRLARLLADAEDVEVATPSGPVMAWRLGVGPALLLVHGWEDDNALWAPLIEACAGIGKAVVVCDLPGHGFSPAEDASLLSLGQAVIAVARALGPIDAVAAHSYGCHAALYALANGFEPQKAVMLATSLPRIGEPTSGGWKGLLLKNGIAPDVAERAWALRMQITDVAPGFSAEPAIVGMTAKGLMIHALDDDLAPAANSERMAALWPDATLALVDDLGHRRLVQDPAVVARIVDFVDDFPG